MPPQGTLGTDFSGISGGGRQFDPFGESPETRYLKRLGIINELNKKPALEGVDDFAAKTKAYQDILATDRGTGDLERRKLHMRGVFGNDWENIPEARKVYTESLSGGALAQFNIEELRKTQETKGAVEGDIAAKAEADAYARAGVTQDEINKAAATGDRTAIDAKLSKIDYVGYANVGSGSASVIEHRAQTQEQIDKTATYNAMVKSAQRFGVAGTVVGRIAEFGANPARDQIEESSYTEQFGKRPLGTKPKGEFEGKEIPVGTIRYSPSGASKYEVKSLAASARDFMEKNARASVPDAISMAIKDAAKKGDFYAEDQFGIEKIANEVSDMMVEESAKSMNDMGQKYAESLRAELGPINARANTILNANASGKNIAPASITGTMTDDEMNSVVLDAVERDYGIKARRVIEDNVNNPGVIEMLAPQLSVDYMAKQDAANTMRKQKYAALEAAGMQDAQRSAAEAQYLKTQGNANLKGEENTAAQVKYTDSVDENGSMTGEKNSAYVSKSLPQSMGGNDTIAETAPFSDDKTVKELLNVARVRIPGTSVYEFDSQKIPLRVYAENGKNHYRSSIAEVAMEHQFVMSGFYPAQSGANKGIPIAITNQSRLDKYNKDVAALRTDMSKIEELTVSDDIETKLDYSGKSTDAITTVTKRLRTDAYYLAIPALYGNIINNDPALRAFFESGDPNKRVAAYRVATDRAISEVVGGIANATTTMYVKELSQFPYMQGDESVTNSTFENAANQIVDSIREAQRTVTESNNLSEVYKTDDSKSQDAMAQIYELSGQLDYLTETIDKQLKLISDQVAGFEEEMGEGVINVDQIDAIRDLKRTKTIINDFKTKWERGGLTLFEMEESA